MSTTTTQPQTQRGKNWQNMAYYYAFGRYDCGHDDVDHSDRFGRYAMTRADAYELGQVTSLPSIGDMFREYQLEWYEQNVAP